MTPKPKSARARKPGDIELEASDLNVGLNAHGAWLTTCGNAVHVEKKDIAALAAWLGKASKYLREKKKR